MAEIEYKHGAGKTKLYRVWSSMRDRCNNPRCKDYKYYGAKGVHVSKEWDEFVNFREWAYQSGYKDDAEYGKCTLDRIDCNGNYGPGNCRWVGRDVQANNMTSNVVIEYGGERHNTEQWGKILGIDPKTIRARFSHGWSTEDALLKSTDSRRISYEINGEKKYIKDLAKEYGINYNTLYNRLFTYGWDIFRALGIDE